MEPLLQRKSSMCYIFCVCVCSLSYPARKAHVSYCHVWSAWLYHVFPRYLINGTIVGKKVIEHKMCFLFSPQLLSEVFLVLRRIKRRFHKGLYVKYTLFFQIYVNLNF